MPVPLHSGEKVLRGIPVSPGVCRGKLRVLRKTDTVVPRREISEAEVPAEIERLQRCPPRNPSPGFGRATTGARGHGRGERQYFRPHLLALETGCWWTR
jgi:hypothetical protein